MIPYDTAQQLANALRVLTLTPATAAFLRTHDPMALQQAERAIGSFEDVARDTFGLESLVDSRRHFVHEGDGGRFVDNPHYASHVVGERVTHDVAAPGRGHVTYRITRVDESGAWGVVETSTVRDLTRGEVE
jgi:hypothetical protein